VKEKRGCGQQRRRMMGEAENKESVSNRKKKPGEIGHVMTGDGGRRKQTPDSTSAKYTVGFCTKGKKILLKGGRTS